jgi:hypothetical protein
MSEDATATNLARRLGIVSPPREDTMSTPQSTISFEENITEEEFFNRVINDILKINPTFHQAIHHWLQSHGIMTLLG